MNNFNFCRPTDFHFGKDMENKVGQICKDYGARKVLIHYGGQSAIKSGLIERVEASLKAQNIEYIMLGGVKPNPRSDLVYQGIEICKEKDIDMILAVGGGSVIDSAKAIAVGALYDGDFWDFYEKKATVTKALPVGCILTIAAAGSEGSTSSVIDHEVNGIVKKQGLGSTLIVPKFSILNPELTYTLPAYQTACGACDIMCHVMERYFTNTKEVELTDQLCEGVLRTMIKMLPIALENPNDYTARANIMWASTIAHNNLCGVDREQDWASHHIEHELSALYDCAHGAGLAVIMPAWMDYVYKHDLARFAQFAHRVFNCPMDFENPENTAKAGIQALRDFWHKAGLPLSFSELGAKKEDIKQLVSNMVGNNTSFTEGHFVVLKPKDIEQILNIAANYKYD